MPKYRYTVMNPDNKELTGTIATPDEKNAREELNHLGFSILKLEEISETVEAEEKEQLTKFEFSAIDKNSKRVAGSIQAQDRFSAYKRLVQEYSFQVEYLVDASLDEKSKNDQRVKGVFELQNKLDEEELSKKKETVEGDFNLVEFKQKQEIFLSQVEFVLGKVKEILDLYENEMKPETKEKIRAYVDKILRIKNSTNLDYIRKSCEELLTFHQQEEIFLHEEVKQKERAKLNLEAKSILMQLHERNTPSKESFHDKIENWRKSHIVEKQDPSTTEYLLNFFASFIIGFEEETNEMQEYRKNLKNVTESLKQYILLYFQSHEPNLKSEIRNNLKNLWRKRKQLKRSLQEAQKIQKMTKKNRDQVSSGEKFSHEVLSLSGWLLTFYLLYYFASVLLTKKNITIPQLPINISVYKSIFVKYFLSILFLFYCSLSIKINYFRRNEIATVIITPFFLIGSLLILFNF